MLFSERGELCLCEGEGGRDLASSDKLDELLLEEVEVEGRVEVEDLFGGEDEVESVSRHRRTTAVRPPSPHTNASK